MSSFVTFCHPPSGYPRKTLDFRCLFRCQQTQYPPEKSRSARLIWMPSKFPNVRSLNSSTSRSFNIWNMVIYPSTIRSSHANPSFSAVSRMLSVSGPSISIKVPKGKLITYSVNGLRFWNRAIKRMGLTHYSLHDIRRLYASLMAAKMMPLELNKLMRHLNVNTTLKHYADVELDKIVTKMNN